MGIEQVENILLAKKIAKTSDGVFCVLHKLLLCLIPNILGCVLGPEVSARRKHQFSYLQSPRRGTRQRTRSDVRHLHWQYNRALLPIQTL